MVRYFFSWTLVVIVGAIVFLSLPWPGLIALFVVSLAALAALAFGFVLVPYALIRAASHRWHGRSAAPRTAAVATFREEYVS
jgi:hypothetical protein